MFTHAPSRSPVAPATAICRCALAVEGHLAALPRSAYLGTCRTPRLPGSTQNMTRREHRPGMADRFHRAIGHSPRGEGSPHRPRRRFGGARRIGRR